MRSASPSMGRPMAEKHRLDSVVKLRKQDEDRALTGLVEAQKRNASADAALEAARDRTRRDDRQRGPVADWEIADSAHLTALREMREAERAAKAAVEQLTRARGEFLAAHVRVEAVRRVAEQRTENALREADDRERKELDELAILRHAPRG